MIIWRIRGKIARTVLCCVVYDSCTQSYAHTYEQFLKMSIGLGLVFVHLSRFSVLCVFWCSLDCFVTPPYGSMEGYLVYCVFCFFCTVTDFSAAEKARGVKFCVRVGLLYGQVFSPFGGQRSKVKVTSDKNAVSAAKPHPASIQMVYPHCKAARPCSCGAGGQAHFVPDEG